MFSHHTPPYHWMRKVAAIGLIHFALSCFSTPASATVTGCIRNRSGNPIPFAFVTHKNNPWDAETTYQTDANGCVTINSNGDAKGEVEVTVHAHNRVVRVQDGGFLGSPDVSQKVRFKSGNSVRVSAQSAFFNLARDIQRTYDRGLREFGPWGNADFPNSSSRTGTAWIGAVWPDNGPGFLAYNEPKSLRNGYPLIHLKSADANNMSTLAHETGHALHFSKLPESLREKIQNDYLWWLITDENKTHCFDRRTMPMLAYLEAFGFFAEEYFNTPTTSATTGPSRHSAFYNRVEGLRSSLTDPNLSCDLDTTPALGDDVEGAVFFTLFVDFARHPAVGLDYVVTTYVECQSLTIQEYGACIANLEGHNSEIYRALVSAGRASGIEFSSYGSGAARAVGDFNGDGFTDLAIGVPGEGVGPVKKAGAVNILYGSATGLSTTNSQLRHQSVTGILDSVEAGDGFGSALAAGDFNKDGYADLAIGVPNEDVGDKKDAGAVSVLYGSASGLSATGNQFWHQDSTGVNGVAETGDSFGAVLTVGDFNKDGYVDLAIGVPGEDVGSSKDAGAVNVLYGSATGLSATSNQIWDQDIPNVNGAAETKDNFGAALAAGDFNSDGFTDLAIGVPGENTTNLQGNLVVDAGAVNILYGSATGLSATGNQIWTQRALGISSDTSEQGDRFGFALAAGNFDNDFITDLAVGVPGEDLEAPGNPSVAAAVNAGAVNIIYGSTTGLKNVGSQFWHQNSPGIAGDAETGDQFGFALAVGVFNSGDIYSDLAIGVPGEDVGSAVDAGAVNILYGSQSGLSSSGSQIWHQGSSGVNGALEAGDRFGSTLAAGKFNSGFWSDLAIGVPGEDVRTIADAGAVNVLYTTTAGLTATGNQIFTQDDVPGTAEAGDQFGGGF